MGLDYLVQLPHLKIFIYLFGCLGSWFRHEGSSAVVHGLSSCGLCCGLGGLWSRWPSVIVACGLSCYVGCGVLVLQPEIN